ncbi:S-layer homology domain-containing protein [Agathobaculum sp.]|uniref:S-layer homology domain-containing protein n=1 Tax=Agathobaculum sp. TaxID=2048138 RepID=UPI002A82274B|nr:S-layer homology domain-containing protein [Agathobaculum sp.]MDY3618726.1 S-layer homology domain-containing protein [Agathobaculum sp.]
MTAFDGVYRHQKKVLALVLAFACAFTMFAGAAFTDVAEIAEDNLEAVDTLVALNVINGYTDGSFQPNGTITRAEMAKMIYVLRTGSDNANAYKESSTKFVDLNTSKSAWAAGYIKYCEALGIIAGKNATHFDPDATVTGEEAAKMLLVTLGYNAETAKLTGSGWGQRTTALADENGILENVTAPLKLALPREYAAVMMYNAVNAPTVRLRDGSYTNMNDDGDAYPTIGRRYMGLYTDTGVLTSISKDNLTVNVTDSDSTHAGSTTFTKLSKDYTDLLGQKVKVMYKDDKTSKVIGVAIDTDNKAYVANASVIEKDTSTKVKFDGSSYEFESATYYGAETGTKTATASVTFLTSTASVNSANVVTLIDSDGNSKIDTVYVKGVEVAKVTYASSSQIVAGGTTYKHADHQIADSIVKDDFVVITENYFEDNKDIVKADKLTNVSINGTKGTSPNFTDLRLDGTWYKVADGKSFSDIKAGNKADAVVVNGVVFDAKKTSGTEGGVPDVLMVLSVGTGLDANKAKFLLADGTVHTEEVSGVTAVAGTVFNYEMDGSKYKLAAVDATTDTDDYEFIATASSYLKNANLQADWNTGKTEYIGATGDISGGGTKYMISDTAKVFIAYGTAGDYKQITGKQLKALTYGSGIAAQALAAYTSKVDGLTRANMIFLKATSEPSGFETNDHYGYVVDDAYASGDSFYSFYLWTGDEMVEVKSKSASALKKGDIIGYSSITEEGKIEDIKSYGQEADATLKTGSIVGAKDAGDKVVFNGESDYFNVTSDTKVLFVDSKAENKEDIGTLGDKTALNSYIVDDNAGVYPINAKYIMDGSEDLAVLVVDIKGDMDLVAANKGSLTITKTATRLASMTVANSDGDDIAAGAGAVAQGQILTVTMTGAATAGNVTVTLTNAKFLDDETTTKDFTVANDAVVTFQIVANGNVTVAATDKA